MEEGKQTKVGGKNKMRYATSGICSSTLDVSVTTNLLGRNLLGATVTGGRVLWLRGAWFYAASGPETVDIGDLTELVAIGTGRRFTVPCASGRTTMVEFPAPGLKFATGCTVRRLLPGGASDTADATGSFETYSMGGWGYEEG